MFQAPSFTFADAVSVLEPARDPLAAAFAAIDAGFARQARPDPKEWDRGQIAHYRAAAIAAVRKARERRAWLKELDVSNPGARVFYPENLDLLTKDLARYRRCVREARRRLRGDA